MAQYLIGVDVGTGSARAGVFDTEGKLLATAKRGIDMHREDGGIAEQSGDQVWRAVCASVRDSVARAGIDPAQVAGLGFDATCSLVVRGADGQGLPVGDPALPGTVVGPVIDAEARDRLLARMADAARESRLVHQGRLSDTVTASGGYFVPPTIFAEVTPDHLLAREELFGPVLGVLRARTLDDAFALAHDTEYALTGGLFSRSPRALARAREELLCGNLYLNRTITGALVERHPFGGFRMSGGGTKAGGRGYLENFLFPRVISENTLRRGFTPPEESAQT